MMQKNEHHSFTGMQKDLAVSKHSAQHLYDARNIRLTQREDGSTLLAVTNEKGTTETGIQISGAYLGHCVLDKYLVVFSTASGTDYIERIDLSTMDKVILYSNPLNFSLNHPIECLGSYETAIVQKVYWTDGNNPPRVINIANDADNHPYNYNSKDTPFDFVPSLRLTEDVNVTKEYDNGGMFPAGMIQYAFTYYNKYGQESNIFYTTELHAISFKSRGGSPEDKVSNSFRVDISNIDTTNKFDYIRVYSILRTSENGTPAVRRVLDIPFPANTDEVSFVDTGTTGNVVDPTVLLYIGGEDIIAQTMTSKDGTLFLGNLKIKRQEIDEDLAASIQTNTTFQYATAEKMLTISDSSAFYVYHNNIDIPPFYKYGEHYRFGIQFQHKSGRWSAPIVLKEEEIFNGIRPYIADNILYYSNLIANLDSDDVERLKALDYVRARSVVVLPTLQDRLILTQGILCPTVFNTKMRVANAPYAMSSWFARPDSPMIGTYTRYDGVIQEVREHGVFNQFKQFENLVRWDWAGEIQGDISEIKDSSFFGVDRSVLTLHSPDIEFDPNFIDTTYTGWKLRLVGRSLITKSASDIDIQTSTPAKDSMGFRKLSFLNSNTYNAGRNLCAAPMWQDALYINDKGDTTTGSRLYMVYPWQRQGSLGNDVKRSDSSTRTSALLKKKMSLLRYCGINKWHNNAIEYDSISDVGMFTSDQVTLSTFGDNSGATYFGNVDTLVDAEECSIYVTPNLISQPVIALPKKVNNKDINRTTSEFTRMKYKSGRHMFLHLGKTGGIVNTLPYVAGSASDTSTEYSVPWNTLTNESTSGIDGEAISVGGVGKLTGTDYGDFENQEKPDVDSLILLSHVESDNDNIFTVYDLYTVATAWQPTRPSEVTGILLHTNATGTIIVDGQTQVVTEYYATATPASLTNDSYYKYTDSVSNWYYKAENNLITFQYKTSYDSEGTLNNISYQEKRVTVTDSDNQYSYYWLAELYRDSVENAFGGNTLDAFKSNVWLPAGNPQSLEGDSPYVIFRYGDTYYQRYDCLKTYAFTQEDENSIVDIVSFFSESRINADGRYDRNRGKTSNLMMSPINFNLYNPVYSQQNNFFSYRILDEDFYKNSVFPNQITWTKEKQAGAETDLWTNITLASTYDMDGSKGVIQSLNTWRDNIYCFQDRGISNILFNSRVQIPTSDGVPIEITNSYKVDGYRYLSDGIGCSNKHTIKETPAAIYFIDTLSHNLYNIGESFNNLTFSHNFNSWFHSNGSSIKKTLYDDVHHDVYLITDETALCFSEMLNEFTSFMDYSRLNIMESYNGDTFALKGASGASRKLFKLFSGKYNDFFGETVSNEYVPNYKPWYLTFVSNGADAGTSNMDKVFGNIDYRMDLFNMDNREVYDPNTTFDYLRAWNEYQDTGIVTLNQRNDTLDYNTSNYYMGANPQKKNRIWRIQIPRNNGTLDRIRNPWCKITLGKNAGSNQKAILQDLNIQYYL